MIDTPKTGNISITWNITAKNIHKRWKLRYKCKKVRCSTNVLFPVCKIGLHFVSIIKKISQKQDVKDA